jgi:ribosomal protein S14
MTSRYCYLRSLKFPLSLYKNEVHLKLKKTIYFDFNNGTDNSISFKLFLLQISTSAYQTKIRRRCVITGRSRAIDRESSFSRFFFKSRTVAGNLTGFKKSS